ncbi:lipase family protein [Paramicrobacterium chengjingii]|uniref:Alpha/beta hydrolase n=1 Tax=Paramicrobacterium chengjingii TaxID=2769067 RepID=A0ABX6YGD2_9MICO|nr:lipase family protein [Microbacterium chengjingii]QPZ37852.1 hypothetical protein HCR76_13695 [Microbacterium chengjingii]
MSITVGSPTMIDTDEISTLADELASFSLECGLASAEASAARVMTAPPNPSSRWSTAGPRIDRAADQLAAASDQAAAVSRALGASASLYLETESTVSGLFNLASSATGAVGGALFGHMLLPLVGATLIAGPGLVAMAVTPGGRQAFSRVKSVLGANITGWLGAHPEVARSPLAMFLVRGVVSGSDDSIKSALGMPPALSDLINDPMLSVPGAAVGLGALGVRAFSESAVSVTPGARSAVSAPTSIADLARRIPSSGAGSPQIRIEEYGNGDSWVVYVGGTVDMGVGGGDESFDMESNLALMADADGGGYRAVEQAMGDAGIEPDDSVTIVGHSQGGLIAERITQSGDYNVQTLVTFGAPSTGADLPDGVNAYAVEHSGDVVPALGGFTDGGERIVVTGDAPPGGDDWMSPHSMSGYEKTATQMDASFDPRFGPLHSALDDIDGGGARTDYRAVRIDEPIPHASGGAAGENAVPDDVASGTTGSHHAGGDGVLDRSEGSDEDALHESGRPDGEHVDRRGPQPSPLPLPDDAIRSS